MKEQSKSASLSASFTTMLTFCTLMLNVHRFQTGSVVAALLIHLHCHVIAALLMCAANICCYQCCLRLQLFTVDFFCREKNQDSLAKRLERTLKEQGEKLDFSLQSSVSKKRLVINCCSN